MKHLAVCLLLAIPTWAQSPKPWHVNVSLTVSGDESIKGRIVSYMSRELRSIPGISVVDSDQDWTIGVVAVAMSNVVALSIVVEMPFKRHVDLLKSMINCGQACNGDPGHPSHYGVTQEVLKDMLEKMNFASEIQKHSLRVDSENNLDKLCKTFVADFDGGILEESRKAWARYAAATP